MILSGAPFIVKSGEHDVDFVAATVIPLIFLTALLAPDIPDDPKLKQLKQLQYVMRGLTIIAGFATMIVAFLQLAGDQTTAGTISVLVLLLITSIFTILAMASSIVASITKFAIHTFLIIVLMIGYLFACLGSFSGDIILISQGDGRTILGSFLLPLAIITLLIAAGDARQRFGKKPTQLKEQLIGYLIVSLITLIGGILLIISQGDGKAILGYVLLPAGVILLLFGASAAIQQIRRKPTEPNEQPESQAGEDSSDT